MATITRTPTNRDSLAWYLGHCNHAEWDQFSVEAQERMVQDDLSAGRNVSLILLALVTTGLVLSAVTLLVVLATT